jgi:hypothetical protein
MMQCNQLKEKNNITGKKIEANELIGFFTCFVCLLQGSVVCRDIILFNLV